jgi:hypothetical protein
LDSSRNTACWGHHFVGNHLISHDRRGLCLLDVS